MKCKDCDIEMEELFTENMTALVRGYFVAKNGKRVSLCVCPKCGRVQGEWTIDSPLRRLPVGEASWKAPKKNGKVVK